MSTPGDRNHEAMPSGGGGAAPEESNGVIAGVIDFALSNHFVVLLGAVFIAVAGYWAIARTPLDAIPDLSDVQVIIFTEYPGQAPRIVEDHVTYPLTTKMLSVPHAKVVRGYSFFNFSFVYVIFEPTFRTLRAK